MEELIVVEKNKVAGYWRGGGIISVLFKKTRSSLNKAVFLG